jgi:Fic family protein
MCIQFLAESNRIEGLPETPTEDQVHHFMSFLELKQVTTANLREFAIAFEPEAELRARTGMDVMVGSYTPPRGGPVVPLLLDALLIRANRPDADPWKIHVEFESLHPFTDCNGRTGRALWAWMMKDFPLLFLHHFYYQTLHH